MVLSARIAYVYGEVPVLETWPRWWLETIVDGNSRSHGSQMSRSVKMWSIMRLPDHGPSPSQPTLFEPVIKSLEALIYTRATLASDPRDKVYAVLALFDPEDRKAIVVDYSPSNTAQDLYVRVAEHFTTRETR